MPTRLLTRPYGPRKNAHVGHRVHGQSRDAWNAIGEAAHGEAAYSARLYCAYDRHVT